MFDILGRVGDWNRMPKTPSNPDSTQCCGRRKPRHMGKLRHVGDLLRPVCSNHWELGGARQGFQEICLQPHSDLTRALLSPCLGKTIICRVTPSLTEASGEVIGRTNKIPRFLRLEIKGTDYYDVVGIARGLHWKFFRVLHSDSGACWVEGSRNCSSLLSVEFLKHLHAVEEFNLSYHRRCPFEGFKKGLCVSS